MTENEDIEKILYMGVGRSGIDNENSKIAKALNELMECRTIGTVEELKALKEKNETLKALYEDAKKEGNHLIAKERAKAIDEFAEKLIGRLEELKTEAFDKWDGGASHRAYSKSIEIVNQLAEEYNNGWIPCSERLPDKQGSYLIQDNHNNIKVAYYDYNTQHTYRAWWIDYTKVNVVAWCELPAPYKEGE